MNDKALLDELLSAEDEQAVLAVLNVRGLLDNEQHWKTVGNLPNNESVVLAQQSSSTAALVEKITNGIDAILLRRCKAEGIDPRSQEAPGSMAKAVTRYFDDLEKLNEQERRAVAEENLVLYATGSKARPCLSLFDAGEGQLPEHFASTFCSLISGDGKGSYKGAIPFVQGRFNMGGTGVLPFCSDERRLQLIVSRVPDEVVGEPHDWGFTLFCFFPSSTHPEWRYLVGSDGKVLTAGSHPLALVPKLGAKSGDLCAPRERSVPSGTLIKMYDYRAPRSNICGELFRKLEEYLVRPMLPLRIIECRPEYRAKVMGVTVWDRLAAWGADRLEDGFKDGASIQVKLSTGEVVPGEIRVFKEGDGPESQENPLTGLRALINGQSHARRDAQFFRNKSVDKEHIAGSMLVTLDFTTLGQGSRNDLLMSNRETFRTDGRLLGELLREVQRELKDHEGLKDLNRRRYEKKIENATSDDDGISALEELLETDPTLAELFGSAIAGRVAARTLNANPGDSVVGEPKPYVGLEFPTYFKRASGKTAVRIQLQRGADYRVSFLTDVKNNYFSRTRHPGRCTFTGDIQPSFHLFNGRLTLTLHAPKNAVEGTEMTAHAVIEDNAGHGPFNLSVIAEVVAPREKIEDEPKPNPPRVTKAPSRPNIIEADKGPDEPPITIAPVPDTDRFQLTLNTGSQLLLSAKAMRPKEEEKAVEFVFKYGLALIAMGFLEAVKKTPEWTADEAACRKRIEDAAAGVGRVIVPLCLTLPKKVAKVSQTASR